MKKIIFMLILFLIPVIGVEGFYCKYSDLAKYKGLASNINATYDYIETENGVTFSITLVNLNSYIYIVDTVDEKKYSFNGNNEITISGYSPGQTVKFKVYSTDSNCAKELLYTIRVVLPNYNSYYKDPLCNGVEEHIYCQKWSKNNISYEEFVKKINSYKDSLIKPPVIEEEKNITEENVLLKMFLDFLLKYYYIILLTIIIICSIIIYKVNKKSDIYR